MKSKVCTKCGRKKRLTEFYKRSDRQNGYRPDCKECNKRRVTRRFTGPTREQALAMRRKSSQKRYHQLKQTNPEKLRAVARRDALQRSLKRFGLSLEDYNILFRRQYGRCAICQQPQAQLRHRLHIDHDHCTGKIRGLLCNRCNRALGYFRDDPVIAKRASHYLARTSK